MYNPLIISNYFIQKSFSEIDNGGDMTPMKLLKLVYISHGWFLGYNKRPLIKEAVYAWKYGPVIVSVYDNIKIYGKGSVHGMIDINKDGKISNSELPSQNIQKFLHPIWNHYKKYNGLQLSSLTHQTNTPWFDTINKTGENSVIPTDLIQQYYLNKKKKNG